MDWDRAFLAGFERAGYVFGRNASLDMSGAGVGFGRLSDAAKRLVQRKVDVIVAFGNEATQAARQATKSTPNRPPDVDGVPRGASGMKAAHFTNARTSSGGSSRAGGEKHEHGHPVRGTCPAARAHFGLG
jgi:hypothetical protein